MFEDGVLLRFECKTIRGMKTQREEVAKGENSFQCCGRQRQNARTVGLFDSPRRDVVGESGLGLRLPSGGEKGGKMCGKQVRTPCLSPLHRPCTLPF